MEIVNAKGEIYDRTFIDGIEGRAQVVSASVDFAKVDPSGEMYVEKDVDGVVGRMPVVKVEGGDAVPSLQKITGECNITANPMYYGDPEQPANPDKKILGKDEMLDAIYNATLAHTTIEGGAKYAQFLNLGASGGDGIETVLLICPIVDIDSTTETWRGVMGEFYLTRGGTTASNRSSSIDIILTKAYNQTHFCNRGNNFDTYTAGVCTYNSIKYLALRFPAYSYFGINFNGLYSGNCVFQSLPYTSVIWESDLTSQPEMFENITTNNFSSKGTIVSDKAYPLTSTTYRNGNFQAFVSNTEYQNGKRAGYGFHTAGIMGGFLYQKNLQELGFYNTLNEDITLWNSSNLPVEQGVWTPILKGDVADGNLTYTIRDGRFVRIGNQVTIYGHVNGTINTLPIGYLVMTGFPYIAKDSVHPNSIQMGYTSDTRYRYMTVGDNIGYIAQCNGDINSALEALSWADATLNQNKFQIHFQLSYIIE